MAEAQQGILAPVPRLGRYLSFSPKAGVTPREALLELKKIADGDQLVVGIGQPVSVSLGKRIPGLRPFPTHFDNGLILPSTPAALWCWLRGADAVICYTRQERSSQRLRPSSISTPSSMVLTSVVAGILPVTKTARKTRKGKKR